MSIKEFYEFDLVNTSKNEVLRLIKESKKIYNIMEGLHILSNFPKDEVSTNIFLENLNVFFIQEYPLRDRFNLTRHFRLLPDLCSFASQITEGEISTYWQSKREEILYLILGTQNKNGSWGYFPQNFSSSKIERSTLGDKWMSLSTNEKNALHAKCSQMKDYYTETQQVPIEKSENSNIWTAYLLTTLMTSGLTDNSAITDGINFLKKQQDRSGGWGFNKGGELNISATCIVLMTLFQANKFNEINTIDESNYIDDVVLKKGLTYILEKVKKLDKSSRLLDIDKGGGADLQDNTEFVFSIPANLIDCFSTGIIDCPGLFKNDESLTKSVLKILNEQINILLNKNFQQIKLWEYRVILESLKRLYALYLNEVSLEEIKHLSGKLVRFRLMGYATDIDRKTGDILGEIGIPRKYPLSYVVIFLLFLLDWIPNFNNKPYVFVIGIVVYLVIMFTVSIIDYRRSH